MILTWLLSFCDVVETCVLAVAAVRQIKKPEARGGMDGVASGEESLQGRD